MGNMILASPKTSDAATLTGSAAQAGAPLSYLQRPQPGEIWASDGVSGVYLQLDRLVADPWNLVWLGFHNGTREGTWRIRASTSAGTLTSSPTFDTGQALKLNGSTQYASQGGLASASSAGVLEGWVRPRSLVSRGAIFATGATTGYVEIISGSATNQIVVNYSGGVLASASNAISLMEWVHVAVVWSGSTVQFLLNGVLVSSASNFGAFSGNVTVTLGLDGSDYFSGDLDEVRYWTVSRTAAQVLANMYGPVTTPTTGLVGYWKLDGSNANAGSAGGTITLTGSPGYVNREPLWCSPDLDDFTRRHAMLWLGTPGWAESQRTERYLRIDLDDPSGDSGDGIQAGRLIVDDAYQPTDNLVYSSAPYGVYDSAARQVLPSGQTLVAPGAIGPAASFTLRVEGEVEYFEQVHRIMRTRGGSRDVLFCADPDVGPYRFHKTAYGLLQQRQSTIVPAHDVHETPFEIIGRE